MDWVEGDLVWFDPGLGHPIPGEIQEVHRAAQVIVVQALIKGKPQTFALQPGEGNLRPRQDLGSSGVDDMTQLEDLHEASLLWNLRLRYDNGLIYTFAGSILIAVNPYKMFPDSYGLEVAKQYAGRPLGTLAPHLFAIGAAAHAALPSPQVVVISGESGSGKTESTKLVMQYLAAVVPGGGSASAVITEQILEAAPLLEAFGNARTARNDNSSRFGKYLEVYFKSGAIVGAKITQYLLEKSRIVTQAPGERNYHVFYEMLGGLSETERTKYGLLEADKYFYLNQGGSDCASGRVDWSSLQSAMQVLGVSEIEREGIIRVLASVLHLGNVYFHRRQLRHGQEGVEVGSDAEIKWAAHLLHISAEGLHRSLTSRTTEARSERLHTPLGIDQALDSRDAFAKALYAGLFNWLVSRINSIVQKGGTHDAHRISILDIFGFEDLAENSFEQLCINYANENLQLYFNKHVFKLEQAEYARERLEWTPLNWDDNLPVIHLLAKKPVGVFHLLDDESNFPRASDMSFLEKCHYNHALNELYSRPRIGAQEFGITHYAGQVWYCVDGFLDKNRDALRGDVLELLASSKLQLVVDLTKQLRAQRDSGKTLPKGSNGRFVTMKPRTPTVAARFSDSLQQLLQSMGRCNPWFVRCVKPNNEKHALKMDMPCVLQQLRYLGMLDTIQIRQRGYPVRLRFQHFVERYRYLMKAPLPRGTPYRELCRTVLESIPRTGIEGPDFQLGATRVFLREALHRMLESGRSDCLKNAAVVIQKSVRGMLVRRKLARENKAAMRVQSTWREYRERKYFKKLRYGAIRAQACWRGKMARKHFTKLKADYKRRMDMQKVQKEREAKKVAKENIERSQVAYLDIPAELAFIFSKIEGWTPLHGDRHLVKVVGTVPGPPVTGELPKDLDQFSFGKFSSVYCNGLRLSTRRDPITAPFLTRAASRDQDFQDALAIFKLILRWANDTPLDSHKEKVLSDYIVHKGLSSRGLRDEILVQICNQVYQLEENQSSRIWQLMAHCLSCFQPSPAFSKYLMNFIAENAPNSMKELLLKKILRNSGFSQANACRSFTPSWIEWRAISRTSDIAVALILPDDVTQTVAIDSWTTCEEAASLAVSTLGISNHGWTVVLDDGKLLIDSCGLDYVLDLVAEKELCPAFPAARNDLFKTDSKFSRTLIPEIEASSPKRPQVPPPEPPQTKSSPKPMEAPIPEPAVEKKIEYNAVRKNSRDLLSRSSALNERYFETDKLRSKSLDDLLAGDDADIITTPEPEPLTDLGLSESRLNDRYHSAERLTPMGKETGPRYQKSQHASRRSHAGSHSSKYMDKSEYATRSSAMSDTSEAPSLASHVRRVRVPSQASDVDQFLDDLFSPVLDGSLDELSDARSLAASIRGGGIDFLEAPYVDDSIHGLANAKLLSVKIKGGGEKLVESGSKDGNLDEYISGLFKPIFISDTLNNLQERSELIETIKGGGTAHHPPATTSGFVSNPSMSRSVGGAITSSVNPENLMQMISTPQDADPSLYQHQVQRAFLQSAMAQNLQIQQQLLAQNQALQTLLSQQDTSPVSPASPPPMQSSLTTHTTTSKINLQNIATSSVRRQSFKNRISQFSDVDRNRKTSSESGGSLIPPPPPPPMPPPIESKDPSETRHFLDPFGRAKTVRIGKWRWPPPQDGPQPDSEEDFFVFKMRQSQRKTTPQSQLHSSNGSLNGSTIEWEEFEVDSSKPPSPPTVHTSQFMRTHIKIETSGGKLMKDTGEINQTSSSTKLSRKSFEIGGDRPPPGSVGKLKLSSEMRQRLEQVTAGHSVRSSISTKSEQRAPAKLEDTRKLMLQQQLSGHFGMMGAAADISSVRSQVERMEGKLSPPPQSSWPAVVPPAPSVPAPPPPIRPPTTAPPAPPPVPKSPPIREDQMDEREYRSNMQQDIPAFIQRQERDTFGARHNWNGSEVSKDTYDSWGRAEAAKLDMVYETSFKKEIPNDRERSRSRSRSRDRDDFSESVWDRTEVEGPPSTGSEREREKEREKRERVYEMRQVEREKESNKVYHPPSKNLLTQIDRETSNRNQSLSQTNATNSTTTTTATFKTHMVQKLEKERKRKISSSTFVSQGTRRDDETDYGEEWPVPSIPAPVPAPPSLKSPATACLTYNRVAWKLRVRKEVFHPSEPIGPPAALDLLFAQIMGDVFGLTPCLRVTPQEKSAAVNMLNGHGITVENSRNHNIRAIVKRHLLDMARSWPLYFSRLFAVQGAPQFPDVSIMGISHNGVYLARRDADYLIVVQSLPFHDLQSAVTLPRPAALQLNMRNGGHLTLHAIRASAIQAMIQSFSLEFRQAQSKSSTISSGARAAAQTLNVPIERLESRQSNHRESSQGRDVVEAHHRSSRQDVVDNQIINHQSYQAQQQQLQTIHNGQLNEESGNTGHTSNLGLLNETHLVLENHVEQAERHQFIKQQSYLHSRKSSASQMHQQQQQYTLEANYITEDSHPETAPSVTKYSLLQFAMQHFRNDHTIDHRSNDRGDRRASSNRTYAELVKWQGTPVRAPLLRLPTDLSPLALECFDCILRYCGDVPLDPELTEVKCVYTVLMHCHKYLALRDEVYCQLMKQTTANRSPCPDSSQRAWRLLSILAAYFGCSDALRPYLMEHLTSAASDRRRSCHGTSAVCLTNLRKTARCGGRKNVPSVEEVTAVSAGRSARRQIYRLPGGAERVVNTRCSTVVADVISELCALLGVDSEAEQQEFSLYCIVQGDAFTMPLAADEYILDVTTELLKSGQPFYLIFCRSVWHFSLKRDPVPTPLYIEVLFNQVAPDYLEGLLLEVPTNGGPNPEVVRDMARIAALLHRAADLNHVPAMKEIKFLLPKPALGIREIRPAQWVSLVQSAWPAVSNLSPGQVKAQFLNVLSAWPLFGSSFFAVKRIWAEEGPHVEDSNPMWRDLILALNRSGVLFLDPNTHEMLQHWPFMEVISTRKVRSEDGALFLDMKVGNLMQQRVIRVQTEQAHEISRLVRQYITMAQISQREKIN
ncbi:unconventional myosin-XV isoform X2 [Episyrphus balteatus]|uniref:unconventional myosin-XV isoform X2 n=1 Tax=Episyrphus balteatus TaxID=286459 RepID=UPI0024861FB5|nr:unconventional myosin-XV isoform X2 [Episyrphus balteatus]XP_055854932.1 unconventional myosin-XV isoform X2 [Episyrphus balteatus]XP_055854933.1 unconventional myosin-XV isoform X2 [Episyrphus balteatus]XP_055854936.1 unconventional myosin-XV isoform X2 [Episyrphus balteatus]